MTNGDGHLVCRLPFISHSPFMRGLVAFFVYLSAFYYMLDSLEIGHHYGIRGNYLRQEMECIERLRGTKKYTPSECTTIVLLWLLCHGAVTWVKTTATCQGPSRTKSCDPQYHKGENLVFVPPSTVISPP